MNDSSTASNVNKVTKIEQKHKDVVIGFVKTVQNKNDALFLIVPLDIIGIILLFWFDGSDEFDPSLCGKNLKITNNNKRLSRPRRGPLQTCYGKKIIISATNATYIWKIKVIGETRNGLVIGIDNARGKYKRTYFWNKKEKGSYNLNAFEEEIRSWNKRIRYQQVKARKIYSIIMMKLDFPSYSKVGILSYQIDDDEEFIAADDVPREKELKYRMAITMGVNNTKIKLLK